MLVYKATSPSNKIYIGITSQTLHIRKLSHIAAAKSNRRTAKFQRAIHKYKQDMKWEVIDSADTWEQLCILEKYYIHKFDSYKNGYNCTLGGEGNLGWKPSKKTREKSSKSQKGRKLSTEHKKKLSLAKLGKVRKPHTEETKKKMSISAKKTSHMIGKTGSAHHNSKVIYCVELDKVYLSITEAAEELSIGRRNISRVLQGHGNAAGGYTFKYTKENHIES